MFKRTLVALILAASGVLAVTAVAAAPAQAVGCVFHDMRGCR